MKLRIFTVLALAAVVIALGFAVSVPAAPPAPAAHVTAVPAAPVTPAATPEPHPEIHEAMASLRRAKEHLEHAAHDFGGHREDAIHAIDAAQHQLEICLQYDK